MGWGDAAYLGLYVIIELLNYILCYHLVFGMEVEKKRINWVVSVLLVSVFHAVTAILTSPLESADFSILSMIVIPCLLLRGRKKDRLGLYLFIFMGMSSLGSIAMLMYSFISGKNLQALLKEYIPLLICQIIPSVCLLVVFLFVRIRKKTVRKVYLGLKTYILFYVSVFCVTLIQASFQGLYTEEIQSPIIIIYGLVSSAASLVFLMTVIWHGVTINREMELVAQISSMEQFNKMEGEYFNQIIGYNEKIRSFRHDVKGHLIALNGYVSEGDNEGAKGYLEKISEEINTDAAGIYTHDRGVDAVICSLCEQGRDKGITIAINGTMRPDTALSSFEWSSIFYNLTQNAIEACEKLSDEHEKKVELTIANINGRSVVSVTNPVREDINIVDGRINTDKEDRMNHGIGTRNVREIVEKHGGTVKFQCAGCVFSVDVIV